MLFCDMIRLLDWKFVLVFIVIWLFVGSGVLFFSYVIFFSGELGEFIRYLIVIFRFGIKLYDGWENVIIGGKFGFVINKRMKMLLK